MDDFIHLSFMLIKQMKKVKSIFSCTY
jgi:hypothetical protein